MSKLSVPLGLGEISIFKKPCEDSDRDMLIKELVAGNVLPLMIPRVPGVPRYASVYPGMTLRPAAHRGRVEREPPWYTGESPGYARYTCVLHGSMTGNTDQLGRFEVHVAANVAKKARRYATPCHRSRSRSRVRCSS